MSTRTENVRVQRWTRTSVTASAATVAAVAALAFVPAVMGANAMQKLTSLFILAILAAMWNALAGYAGLVSVGQQAFIGIGAYSTLYLTDHGVGGYLAIALAGLVAGALALPTSLLVLRLRAGEFAIATWVVAIVFGELVSLDSDLGGGTGRSLTALGEYDPTSRVKYTYWMALAIAVLLLAIVFFLLRRRTGASLQAIRDNEQAAASVGVRVLANKFTIFVIAAFGCGAAGALILAQQLFVDTTTIFSVNYTASMIFMVLVGGLGTFEGPILGAIVLFVIQNEFGDQGVWYLVGLGMTAIVFALLLPRGVWGAIEGRFGIRLLPVGYQLRGIELPPRTEPDVRAP